MKKLIFPVLGLFLAACTYQFAPTGSENTTRPDYTATAPSTATAGISLPAADDGGFSPGTPGGDMGSPAEANPEDGMPDLPGGGSMPGG